MQQGEPAPSMNLDGLPEGVASTLQHIVWQLGHVTDTVKLLAERLEDNEDRVLRLGDKLDRLLASKDQQQQQQQQPLT